MISDILRELRGLVQASPLSVASFPFWRTIITRTGTMRQVPYVANRRFPVRWMLLQRVTSFHRELESRVTI